MSVAFLLTTLVVVATPGAGALFTIGAGLGRGRRASLVAAVGCTIGIVPHLVAAATGLAALMHASALAFQGLKYAGVAYLLFLAWTTLRDKGALGVDAAEPSSAWRTIRQAVLLNLLNPKLTIFFVAFLPQFVHPDEPNALWHMLGLSAVFMLVTLGRLRGLRRVRGRDAHARPGSAPGAGVAASLVRRVLRPPRRTAGGDGPMTVEVTYEGVLAAAEAIAPHLPPTPAWSYPLLDQAAGVTVVVKHENVQPTGAFKVRGGINLALALNADEREAGLVTASTGNHAQSVCYGARLVGATAVIVVPESAPPSKVAAVRALGGEVVMHGPTMDEAVEEAKRLAGERGLRYVDPGNEPAIVHGHATVYLELLQRHPELEAIYVPVGSGTGASGACVVREVLAPSMPRDRRPVVGGAGRPHRVAGRAPRSGAVPDPVERPGDGNQLRATAAGHGRETRRLRPGVGRRPRRRGRPPGQPRAYPRRDRRCGRPGRPARRPGPPAALRRHRDRRQRQRGRDPGRGEPSWRRDHPPLNGPAAVPDLAREGLVRA